MDRCKTMVLDPRAVRMLRRMSGWREPRRWPYSLIGLVVALAAVAWGLR